MKRPNHRYSVWAPGFSSTWSQPYLNFSVTWANKSRFWRKPVWIGCVSFAAKRALANIPPGSLTLQAEIREWLAQGLIIRDKAGLASKHPAVPPRVFSKSLSQLSFLFEAAEHSYPRFIEITITCVNDVLWDPDGEALLGSAGTGACIAV